MRGRPKQIAQEGAVPGQVLTWNGSDWVPTTPLIVLPANYLDGFGIARNAANPNSQIDIAPGVCRDSTNAINLSSTGTLIVNIAISGAGGLDTGSEAPSTWYYVWIIYNSTSDTYAGLLSTSSSSPTMPSGYIYKRRIGSTYNNSSSNFRGWIQFALQGRSREYTYALDSLSNCSILSGGSSTSWTDVSAAAHIPPTSRQGFFRVTHIGGSTAHYTRFRMKGSSESEPVSAHNSGGLSVGGIISSSLLKLITDTAQKIQYQNNALLNSTNIWVYGYVEEI